VVGRVDAAAAPALADAPAAGGFPAPVDPEELAAAEEPDGPVDGDPVGRFVEG
jgi:hypothetical protein